MSRIYSTHLNYITLQKTDLKSTEAYRKAGSESKLIGLSHLPLVENIGFAEKRLQHDGQEITTVYPVMYFSKVPRRYSNAPFVHESNFWCNKNHMAYYKGAKYLGFFSFRSLKMRENILVLLSLSIF